MVCGAVLIFVELAMCSQMCPCRGPICGLLAAGIQDVILVFIIIFEGIWRTSDSMTLYFNPPFHTNVPTSNYHTAREIVAVSPALQA
ncbi:hypothetical protein P175DRAFT_0528052 [Aspergillus ochraceoroseus IBT 24754]|uniref:Uncharacterized protein n=1 Tax=Aspergillus ochraceoroseus IBT 24754 TaxID=1392256 RepID=A0A2T5M7Q0_9EURO|nr:uncharacterized protein P175DRAFT_0528052 [Aspergillus ochraceoroseus IBT 24754]PTU24562.1 hypothetical protein P175DRAFT_0528052 [Aspergillus ochraceoroseus IBT 24754]